MNGIDRIPLTLPTRALATRIRAQQRHPNVTRSLPTFYRNLEETLDERRASYNFLPIVLNDWQTNEDLVDFASNDILSLNSSGILREEFFAELAEYPEFSPGSGGARLMDGDYTYLSKTEKEIAEFHGAEAGLIVNSGFDANFAVWATLPRPGDAIVYDALVHASSHDGISRSLAMKRVDFAHNDVKSFRNALLSVLDSQPQIKQGRRSVLVAVESVYSMEGDVCPLQELVDVADELFQEHGNIEFIIDEAHSTGIIGPKGAGLVCELGLESEIAVRIHTYGKAMGTSGGKVQLQR